MLSIVIGWLYEAFQASSSYQATLGKRACGIKVTDEEGRQISFGRATGRHFAKIISGLILIGVMAAFTQKKQALHDVMEGTAVVKGCNAVGVFTEAASLSRGGVRDEQSRSLKRALREHAGHPGLVACLASLEPLLDHSSRIARVFFWRSTPEVLPVFSWSCWSSSWASVS